MKILSVFLGIVLFLTPNLIAEEKIAKLEISDETYPSLKVVYDWNLPSPENVNQALNYISNHLKAYTNYSPLAEVEIVVVSHGPEVAIFAKQNKEKFKEVIERMKSFYESYGIQFYVCNNALKYMGYSREDILPFVIITPAGVAKLSALQEEGYRLVPTLTWDMKTVKEKYGKK
jgi:intracellular sulfur oxidation DsrE/DsrF family protein